MDVFEEQVLGGAGGQEGFRAAVGGGLVGRTRRFLRTGADLLG